MSDLVTEHDIKDPSLATGGRYRIEWAEKEMPQGKARLKNLDNIRGGNDMEYILAHDKRLLEWWNNL